MITADLSNKVAIVTGGASGIGLAISKLLLHAGAKLIMNDISLEAPDIRAALDAASLSSSSTDNMRYVAADIADPSTPRILVDAAKTSFGQLDILINNAATAGGKAPIPFECLEKLDDEFWACLLNVNLISPFRMTKEAAPELKKTRGIVINTASVAGLTGQASSIPYAASKAGLINLTQNLARALAPDIRVNAVAPGWIDTPWTKSWPADRRQRSIEKTLLKRLGTAEDIAETMLFLAAGGKYMTGQTIVVDGGR